MTEQYMLLFSLGPVQSFIAQARKTRDLWLGSFLLSTLMQQSMQHIPTTQLVFPANPRITGYIPNLPNKYIATFGNMKDAEDAARQSEKDIIDAWHDICNDVWDAVLAKAARDSVTLDLWDNQTNPANMFEIYWVVVSRDGQAYKDWLKKTQILFDQRKNLRDFMQQIEEGEKSTISGQRAALRGKDESRPQVRDFWKAVASKRSQRDIDYDGNERLDAIDTVKRFAHLSDSLARLVGHTGHQNFKAGFPSTSSIATASFVEQLLPVSEQERVAPPLTTWLRESKKLNDAMTATIPLLIAEASKQRRGMTILERDGDCFFPETFSVKRLEKEFHFDDTRKGERDALAKEGPNAIATLLRATDALTSPITRPTPYYAMIQMDGDKMGRLINGVTTKEEHQAISQALSDFSHEKVPDIVEANYPGRLIYAGGDDVFALAPLARDIVQMEPKQEGVPQKIVTVLDIVDQLQQQYQLEVRKSVVNDEPIGAPEGQNASPTRKELVTASVGIAIAHHYTSLSYVRRVSKEAVEHFAKDHYGRNALVVTVLRRSGEQTRVGCKWLYSNLADEAQPMRLFARFYNLFVNDILSPSAVHTLLDEVPTLVGLPDKAQASEIKRVLKRQRDPAKKELFLDQELETKAQNLVDLAQAMDGEEKPDETERGRAVDLHAEERRYGLVEVLGWLLVLLFLARKEQE